MNSKPLRFALGALIFVAVVLVSLLTRVIVLQSHTEECLDLIGSQLSGAVEYHGQKWDDASVHALWQKILSYGGHFGDANVRLVGYAGGEGYGILKVDTFTNFRDVAYVKDWHDGRKVQ